MSAAIIAVSAVAVGFVASLILTGRASQGLPGTTERFEGKRAVLRIMPMNNLVFITVALILAVQAGAVQHLTVPFLVLGGVLCAVAVTQGISTAHLLPRVASIEEAHARAVITNAIIQVPGIAALTYFIVSAMQVANP